MPYMCSVVRFSCAGASHTHTHTQTFSHSGSVSAGVDQFEYPNSTPLLRIPSPLKKIISLELGMTSSFDEIFNALLNEKPIPSFCMRMSISHSHLCLLTQVNLRSAACSEPELRLSFVNPLDTRVHLRMWPHELLVRRSPPF